MRGIASGPEPQLVAKLPIHSRASRLGNCRGAQGSVTPARDPKRLRLITLCLQRFSGWVLSHSASRSPHSLKPDGGQAWRLKNNLTAKRFAESTSLREQAPQMGCKSSSEALRDREVSLKSKHMLKPIALVSGLIRWPR